MTKYDLTWLTETSQKICKCAPDPKNHHEMYELASTAYGALKLSSDLVDDIGDYGTQDLETYLVELMHIFIKPSAPSVYISPIVAAKSYASALKDEVQYIKKNKINKINKIKPTPRYIPKTEVQQELFYLLVKYNKDKSISETDRNLLYQVQNAFTDDTNTWLQVTTDELFNAAMPNN